MFLIVLPRISVTLILPLTVSGQARKNGCQTCIPADAEALSVDFAASYTTFSVISNDLKILVCKVQGWMACLAATLLRCPRRCWCPVVLYGRRWGYAWSVPSACPGSSWCPWYGGCTPLRKKGSWQPKPLHVQQRTKYFKPEKKKRVKGD